VRVTPTSIAACACIIDASKADPDQWPDAWNWWIEEGTFDPIRLLTFWRWWLQDAIPQAWTKAEEHNS